MQEKTFTTPCGEIHYWVSITDPEKPAFIFLPGLTADHRLFEKQLEFFEGKENILVWDAPAHAASRPFRLDFSLADKAKWLDAILSSESIAKPVIVGQSMGGYVGQMYSELFPDKLAGFAVIDSAPLQRKYMTSFEIWLMKNTGPLYRAYKWETLVKEGSRGCAETEYGRTLMKDIMSTYSGDKEEYVRLVSHGYKILAAAIEADLLYEIRCPVKLICGEKDKAGSTKSYNKKWTRETGIPMHWIPNAGHNSNTDAPEQINSLLQELMSEVK